MSNSHHHQNLHSILKSVIASAALLLLASCGGGGGSTTPDPGTSATTTTVISGKVTLSSSVTTAFKPVSARMKAIAHTPKMKAVKGSYKVASKPLSSSLTTLPGFAAGDVVNSAFVFLYDSDHPEWPSPVAESETDSDGNYSLSVLANAAANGDAYVDGDPIPVGNYTLLAYKPGGFDPTLGITTDPVVAVQQVVSEFTGTVTGNDLVAQTNDVQPQVLSMFGQERNLDGTNTWGSSALEVADNELIQVSFDMAMSRGSISSNIVVSNSTVISGSWALSADWLTATFTPDANLPIGEVITVAVGSAITNVYGNDMEDDASGSFTVVASDTTAPTVSLNIADAAADVAITEAVRVHSDEALNVSSLLLQATPDVGVRPGVIFIGNDTSNGFVYEFTLGVPLALGQTYSYTVSGITDAASNAAADLTGTFTTEGTTVGVDGTADAATQTAQTDAKDAFGKWTRAMSDGNLALLQSMMTGDYVFEYDINQEIMQEDFNRDGRLSFSEFSSLIEGAFLQWENCGTTISGDIIGDINVVNDTADFQFSFGGSSSTVVSPECSQAVPDSDFFATVRNINGAWFVSRLSQTIDTRDKTITVRDVIEVTMTDPDGATPVDNGAILSGFIDGANPVSFSWTHETGVSSYIILFANSRDPSFMGMAFVMDANNIVDSTTNEVSLELPQATQSGFPNSAVDITKLLFRHDFGNNEGSIDIGFDRPGEEIEYEIIGLGTKAAGDFAADTSGNFSINGAQLVRDIVSISSVKRFKNPGTRKDITAQVAANATDAAAQNFITFSEFVDGYDVGASHVVHLSVTSSNANTTGSIWLGSSNGWNEIPVAFDANGVGSFNMSSAMNTACASGVTPAANEVCLYQGWNWIDVWDGYDLYHSFSVGTAGGIPPAISLNVTDAAGGVLSFDYAQTPSGTSAVNLSGSIDTFTYPEFTTMTNFNVDAWLWNDAGVQAQAQGTYDVATHTFDFGSVPIFTGDNWISVNIWADDGAGGFAQANTHFGVFTDNSTSVYVAPFGSVAVASVDGAAIETGNWGNGSDWDASTVTATTSDVTISGTMAASGAMYWQNSEGGFAEGQITPVSGNFSVTLTLYNGWNWISFDDMQGGWYNVNIFTENGVVVPKPVIVSVNGVDLVDDGFGGPLTATTDQCTATIVGTAAGVTQLDANWSGSDGFDYFSEHQQVVVTNDSFTVTMPLIGGTGSHNFVDFFDPTNNTWAGVEIFTTDTTCAYSLPVLTVDSVSPATQGSFPEEWDAGAASSVTVSGTSTVPGRTIKLDSFVCGSNVETVTNASTAETVAGSGVYDWSAVVSLYDMYQHLNVTDGQNWQNISVSTTNPLTPPAPAIAVTVAGATNTFDNCGGSDWEAGAALVVTISGSTTGTQDGFGEYWAGNDWGNFEIIGGVFSFDVNLFNGFNNININDADWNNYNLNINSTNGNFPPQFIAITSPTHGATGVVGDVNGDLVVTADLDQTGSGFSPDQVNAHVSWFNPTTQMFTDVSFNSDPNAVQQFGDLPITIGAGTLTFTVPGVPTNSVDVDNIRISVDGCGIDGCHGHSITLNVLDLPGETFYKTGQQSGAPSMAESRHRRARSNQAIKYSK